MITANNILFHELIGMDVEAYYGENGLLEVKGKVIMETKNTITLFDKKKKHILNKELIKKLRVNLIDGVCFIKGSSLIGKPEDRLFR